MGTNLVWVPLMFLPSSVSISTPPPSQTHTPALPLQALLPSLPLLFSSPKSSFYVPRSEDGSKGNGRLQCIKGIVRQKRSSPFQWESQRLRGGASSKKAARKTSRENDCDFLPRKGTRHPFLDVHAVAISRRATGIWCEFDISRNQAPHSTITCVYRRGTGKNAGSKECQR